MYVPFLIARRYFLSKTNTNAINIISMVAMTGISVGTMALIVVLSVFNGFESLVKSLYNSFYPDILVMAEKGKTYLPDSATVARIERISGVSAVCYVVEENAMLSYNDRQYIARVKGVDDAYATISRVEAHILSGQYRLEEGTRQYAILGSGVRSALGVNVQDGISTITVYTPSRERAGPLRPDRALKQSRILAGGSFSIQQEFDIRYIIVPIGFMRELLDYDKEVTALEIGITPQADMYEVQSEVQSIMGGGFRVQNRYEQNAFLYQVMQTERWAVYCILTFILLIAAFNLIGALTMLVIDKKPDIAILKSMGAGNKLIQAIFVTEGMLLSFIGTCIGAVLGLGLCLAQVYGKLLRIEGTGSFVVDAYPVELHGGDFLLVFGTVFIISLLASWHPARKAAREGLEWKQAVR